MFRNLALVFFLSACCPDTATFCDEASSECVQAAFDPGETCAVAAQSAELGCSAEFDDYLMCLDSANDCGSCEPLRANWSDCTTNVCGYASRIDRGCFEDRPDCGPIFTEGNTPPACLPLWRDYILCLARSSPAEESCDDQCIDIFIDFWSCD